MTVPDRLVEAVRRCGRAVVRVAQVAVLAPVGGRVVHVPGVAERVGDRLVVLVARRVDRGIGVLVVRVEARAATVDVRVGEVREQRDRAACVVLEEPAVVGAVVGAEAGRAADAVARLDTRR